MQIAIVSLFSVARQRLSFVSPILAFIDRGAGRQCRDYNPETHKLIGARELGLMKPTAHLINTARGRIVDEPALIRALQDGAIAGAALDVYWNEPPVTYDPQVPVELRKLDNVILNPHNGGATWAVRGARAASVARGIVTMLNGGRAPGLLNPEIYAEG
jgi:glyoxylate reductase